MTTLPPHIANAETPRTDRIEWDQACNFDVGWEDHSRQLERENIYLREVAERMASALRRCYDVCDWPGDGSSRQDEAIAAYEQLKKDLQ